MEQTRENITQLILYKINKSHENKDEILNALHQLLNEKYIKYDIENSVCENNLCLNEKTFQNIIGHINEKTSKRKSNGVYYTSNDVAKYIVANSFVNILYPENSKIYNFEECVENLRKLDKEKIYKMLFNKKVIDPTCGTGEFLLSVAELKTLLLNPNYTDKDILNIVNTIYGNDIDEDSNDISKIRLFFFFAQKLKERNSILKLAEMLKQQFYNIDFVSDSNQIDKKFDIIVGNPPYVEYGKYPEKEKIRNKFGNVYADVIKNSIEILNEHGIIGYVIPLSYTSTSRMKNIREYVFENMSKQFILNFADRPDCLFPGVHQKLNILMAQKGKGKQLIYTSSYKHWYKSEREQLLNNREVIDCEIYSDQFIPKIGNEIEKSIFKKIYTNTENNILAKQDKFNGKEVFLNMRACFWIKAFSFSPGSSEYKVFEFDEDILYFIVCLLNSSLFWLYWTIMSDCWHITTKELRSFYVPENLDRKDKFKELSQKLEEKLEKTKKYVGTKQTEYEYKHKYCKDVIDQIDNELAHVYGLSEKERMYVQSFALNYRVGGNND